jgi:transposase
MNAVSDPDDVARLKAELAVARAELTGAKLLIEQLKAQLAVLRRMSFGRSSEKLNAEITQLELLLEDLEEGEAERIAPVAVTPSNERERRHPVRRPLPSHLPREEILHHPGDACPCCGGTSLSQLGEDVTEVLERIPAQFKVIRHIRPRLSCRRCETIIQALAPDLPIDKGRPGPALIANVVVGKYIDGLPLYRQAGIIARDGVDIDRATLCDWVGRAAWWLAPVAEAIGKHVMAAPAIHTDDTPIGVLAPGRGRTKTGRIWTYVVDERPWAGDRPPAALYRYSPDRKGERPAGHLADFAGVIHADGYAGYEALTRAKAPSGRSGQRIAHAACWAHVRRKLYDVDQKTRSPIAAEGLRRIGVLYDIERDINGLPSERRRAVRAERSLSLLADLRIWMETERRRLSSKTDLAKALQYALNRWDALARFTTDGGLAIDNNVAERALRGIAVTRKNFLFLGSDKGGDRAAIIYTALETARLNGVNPEAWLADVLDQLARGRSQLDLKPLMPWNWQKPAPLAIAA